MIGIYLLICTYFITIMTSLFGKFSYLLGKLSITSRSLILHTYF